MSKIYFLNVKEGDCTWIHHDSGRNTVIDICNGNNHDYSVLNENNYGQKDYPTNPIYFLHTHFVKDGDIFRFILTHPDMDHMDGIQNLFNYFHPVNFWDTDNKKTLDINNSWIGSYKKEDWEFYQSLHNKRVEGVTYLRLYSGARGQYYNDGEDNDGIYILSPTKALVEKANESKNYNLLSYVLLLKEHGRNIIFAGDSGKDTWDSILEMYDSSLSNIDVLIAPHHGRKTGGNDEYLDILKPKVTLLGNAKSTYLDYNAFNRRRLIHFTNNEAGNIMLNITDEKISLFFENKKFVEKINRGMRGFIRYDLLTNGWYVYSF